MRHAFALLTVVLTLALVLPASADWDIGDPAKWVQLPDESPEGLYVSSHRNTYGSLLADDFLCTETGLITGIHIWGARMAGPFVGGFNIAIYSDIPAEQNPTGYSMPGDLLWEYLAASGSFTSRDWTTGTWDWLEPPDYYWPSRDITCQQFNFEIDEALAFVQAGTPSQPVVYWLSVQAYGFDPMEFTQAVSAEHWNDDAVFVVGGQQPYVGEWDELRYPEQHPHFGESIDLSFVIVGEESETDWGDAPDPTYPTLAASDGAYHYIDLNLSLMSIDPEPDGQPDPNALGDDNDGSDDEDGIAFLTPLSPGQDATVRATLFPATAGRLDAWIDFAGDGSWDEPGDQIIVDGALVSGGNDFTFPVPPTAVPGTVTYARFRLSSVGGLPPTGGAPDGEVEDYEVMIATGSATKWLQSPDLSEHGMAVECSIEVGPYTGVILADDYLCTETGPVTGLHIWASWLNDLPPFGAPEAIGFALRIWSDIPAGTGGIPWSRPGTPLWLGQFGPGQFDVEMWETGLESWFDPVGDWYSPLGDTTCWHYSFPIDEAEAFVQQGTPEEPVIYWLEVQAFPESPDATFGWKASADHWNDDGVYTDGEIGWQELRYPSEHPYAGQSIDLAFAIGELLYQEDWGDAPDPTYPTLASSGGASHVIVPGVHLGALIDAEGNGLPSPDALGDDNTEADDEDGVTFTTPIVPGQDASVDVVASVPGFLDAWIDFNGNGDWATPTDQIFAGEPLVPGLNTLTFPVPPFPIALDGPSYARFRFSTAGGLSFTGPAPGGEVEDYEVTIEPGEVVKWVQLPDLSPEGIVVDEEAGVHILADDFECTEQGLITKVYVWGEWYFGFVPDPSQIVFTLSIHEDIPAEQSPTGYSMPGEVLWWREFTYPEFAIDLWQDGLEYDWMIPPAWYFADVAQHCYIHEFDIPEEEAFEQLGSPGEPIVYWLDVHHEFLEPEIGDFAWCASIDHWNDDAVWVEGEEPYVGMWGELRYPVGHPYVGESIDLAFAIELGEDTGVPDGEDEVPRSFGLRQNVPNPFNPTTTIAYDVPAGGGRVTIEVFDVAGRLVTTLVDGHETEGKRSVTWNGTDADGHTLGSGVYFYRMTASGIEETRKMLLLK